jgi:hypothetical protein
MTNKGGLELMSAAARRLPRIVLVVPSDKHLTLRLHWDNGKDTLVNLSGPVNTSRLYAPLRDNDALFRSVRVGEHGADIVWSEGLEMSADTLWRLAQEQANLKDYLLSAGFAGNEPDAFDMALKEIRQIGPPLAPRKLRFKP